MPNCLCLSCFVVITYSKRKALSIRDNGRSSDFVTPSIIWGCGYRCSYCTMRRHKPEGVDVATNIDTILDKINDHALSLPIKKPNQVDDTYWVYEIGMNSDLSLHAKHFDWQKVFRFFLDHKTAKATFATKRYYVPLTKSYYFNKKVRIRFSIMPENLRKIYEPYTDSIERRLEGVNYHIESGYDVHLNFSPVIVSKNGLVEYEKLFNLVDKYVHPEYKPSVKAEVIFLTHNEKLHNYNVQNNIPGEDLLWNPQYQEKKVSQYGGTNVRYKNKAKLISQWTALHNQCIPWNTIRYIF